MAQFTAFAHRTELALSEYDIIFCIRYVNFEIYLKNH